MRVKVRIGEWRRFGQSQFCSIVCWDWRDPRVFTRTMHASSILVQSPALKKLQAFNVVEIDRERKMKNLDTVIFLRERK